MDIILSSGCYKNGLTKSYTPPYLHPCSTYKYILCWNFDTSRKQIDKHRKLGDIDHSKSSPWFIPNNH